MNKYEIMYMINPNISEEKRAELITTMHEIITNNNGTIDKVTEWGLKDLAYEIKDLTKAYYVITEFSADVTALNEFERLMRINHDIIRYNIINLKERL